MTETKNPLTELAVSRLSSNQPLILIMRWADMATVVSIFKDRHLSNYAKIRLICDGQVPEHRLNELLESGAVTPFVVAACVCAGIIASERVPELTNTGVIKQSAIKFIAKDPSMDPIMSLIIDRGTLTIKTIDELRERNLISEHIRLKLRTLRNIYI